MAEHIHIHFKDVGTSEGVRKAWLKRQRKQGGVQDPKTDPNAEPLKIRQKKNRQKYLSRLSKLRRSKLYSKETYEYMKKRRNAQLEEKEKRKKEGE